MMNFVRKAAIGIPVMFVSCLAWGEQHDTLLLTVDELFRRGMEMSLVLQADTLPVASYMVAPSANYREKQISGIFIGQDVRIRVDAIPGKVFMGKVTAISEATGSKYSLVPTDNSAGNFVKVQQRIPVRIEFTGVTDEDMAQMRAGMMVVTEAVRRRASR